MANSQKPLYLNSLLPDIAVYIESKDKANLQSAIERQVRPADRGIAVTIITEIIKRWKILHRPPMSKTITNRRAASAGPYHHLSRAPENLQRRHQRAQFHGVRANLGTYVKQKHWQRTMSTTKTSDLVSQIVNTMYPPSAQSPQSLGKRHRANNAISREAPVPLNLKRLQNYLQQHPS